VKQHHPTETLLLRCGTQKKLPCLQQQTALFPQLSTIFLLIWGRQWSSRSHKKTQLLQMLGFHPKQILQATKLGKTISNTFCM